MAAIKRSLGLLGAILLASCASEEEGRSDEPVPVVAETVRFIPDQTAVEALGAARWGS